MAVAEMICTKCDGSGEIRYKAENCDPMFNVAGKWREPNGDWLGACRECGQRGFVRLKSLPPLLPRHPAR